MDPDRGGDRVVRDVAGHFSLAAVVVLVTPSAAVQRAAKGQVGPIPAPATLSRGL